MTERVLPDYAVVAAAAVVVAAAVAVVAASCKRLEWLQFDSVQRMEH